MPDASIVIVTRNRKEKAREAIRSALAQVGDNEVILMDDGSTDGTSEFIGSEFPAVIIHRSEKQDGYIVHRSRSADIARSPVIISIDDDAVFDNDQVVAQTMKMFDDPIIGAVAIPHMNHFTDGRALAWWPPLPDSNGRYVVSSFIGTAYAIRLDVFRQLNGFHNDLFHWGEETEYCQRLYGAGYAVRLGDSGLVRHYPEGSGKYSRKVNRYISRNLLLIAWRNTPLLYLAPAMIVVLARSLIRIRRGWNELVIAIEGLLMGVAGMFSGRNPRQPIPTRRYRAWMEIRKRKLVRLDEVARMLTGD